MRNLFLALALLICGAAFSQTQWTEKSAQKWMKKGKYAQGLKARPHKTTNAVEFATQYEKNKELWDKAFKWMNDSNLYTVSLGKHVIEEGKLWFSIEEYVPRKKAKRNIEKHNDFIDFQYTIKGEELMGLADPEHSKVKKSYVPKKDLIVYSSDSVTYYETSPKKFFLFFPSDLHQPSVLENENDTAMVRKIVFKIQYAK